MAEVPAKIESVVKRFLSELEAGDFHIRQAVLFGSYAKGTENEWSDIDLAIVSDKFTGNRLLDKASIRKLKAKVDFSISPMPFHPEDFDVSNLFVKEILETGIKII